MTLGKCLEYLQKLNIHIPYATAIPLLMYMHKYVHTHKNIYKMFKAVWYGIDQNWNNLNVLPR